MKHTTTKGKISTELTKIFAGIFALVSLSACTGNKENYKTEPTEQKTAGPSNAELKIGATQEFENLNPLIMQMMMTTYMSRMVSRSLVNLDANIKLVTQLAKDIPTLENKQAELYNDKDIKTGKTIQKIKAKWEIIPNAKWGDGKPLVCADFRFAREVAMTDTVSVGDRETYSAVEKLEIDPTNPQKCTFYYDKARWDFNLMQQFYPLPEHLERPIFEAHKAEKEGYEKNSLYVKEPTNPGLYHGPYVISEVKLGSHVMFTPNPFFYGTPPKFKKIIVKVIPNTGTLEANLRSGEIDMISTMGLTFDQALNFDKKVKLEKLPYEVLFQPGITYEHVDLQLNNEILKDLKVREALVYGMDRVQLTKALFEGKQEPALHFMSPIDSWFTKDPKYFIDRPYDKQKAGKLLDEAGWKMGSDGMREKNGQKLAISFMSTSDNRVRELVEQYLKDQWKQIGISIEIRNEPARVFFGETIRKGKYPGMAMFAWSSSPENNPIVTFATKNIPTEKNGYSGQNTGAWSNKLVDQWMEDLNVEFNAEKRKDLIGKIVKEYTREVPTLPLYFRSDIAVIPSRMKNYKLTGHQFPETNEVEKWTVE